MLDRIGNTPLVRLRRIPEGIVHPEVEVWAKLEWHNPGGSVKDRAAWSIVRDAEASGRLRPGMRLLDSGSGNTGIAYGMIAAVRGHRVTLCMPANANAERRRILAAYGVEVVETDAEEGSDGALRRARALAIGRPDLYLYLDQYGNDANWRAHVATTAPEIWRDTGGRITHWVATLGTTGTFVGTSRRLKQLDPQIRCVSVQPAVPGHGLTGLKHMPTAIAPGIWDASLADEALEAPSAESLALVRRLAREEGLLAGISSGAALWGALEVAKRLRRGVVVTLFPDGGERYLSEDRLWEGA